MLGHEVELALFNEFWAPLDSGPLIHTAVFGWYLWQ